VIAYVLQIYDPPRERSRFDHCDVIHTYERDELETCGVPKKVLAPVNNDTGTFKYLGDANYGATAVLNIRGV
jgi:hypothetical protein